MANFRSFATAIIILSCIDASQAVFAGGQDAEPPLPSPERSLPIPAEQFLSNTSVFGGLGYIDYLNGTQNNTFAYNSLETDSLTQSTQTNNVGYTLGFAKKYTLQNRILQKISIGPTLRFDPTTFTGNVNQFEDPTLSNYTYSYQVRPTSLFAESDLYFQKIRKLYMSPFIIVGVGFTLANLDYQETPAASDICDATESASGWTFMPDLAIGAGLQWDIKKKYFMKTQYLFQYRGNADVSSAAFPQALSVNLNEQSVDIIFGYKFK